MGSIVNGAISWVKGIIAGIIDLLPDSPFQIDIPDYVVDIIGYVNYFIPIGSMVKILTAWGACILLSFPRMSGDDPVLKMMQERWSVFSPHERG